MIFYRFDVSLQSLLDYFEARYDILYFQKVRNIRCPLAPAQLRKHLNEIFDFNPTAENIGKWIVEQFDSCYKVNVQESLGNTATVIDENKIKGIEFIIK